MTQESEIKIPSKYQSSDMLKSLESLVDDTLQVYEFNGEQEIAVSEICDTITMMLAQMKATVSISPGLVGPNNTVKRVTLGHNGRVVLTHRDDEVEYMRLKDFRPSLLVDILNDLFPKLKDVAVEYRKNLEERLSLYRAANKKLKQMEKLFTDESKIGLDDITDNKVR